MATERFDVRANAAEVLRGGRSVNTGHFGALCFYDDTADYWSSFVNAYTEAFTGPLVGPMLSMDPYCNACKFYHDAFADC